MTQRRENLLTGQFLIAMPALEDPNFSQTVTYLCQHSTEGALGIIISRPLDMRLSEVLESMQIPLEDEAAGDIPVFWGGPVQPERGFVIHSPVGNWQGTLAVSDEIGLTTSKDIVEAIACGCGPNKLLVSLGYAGWGEGQLEREILENTWLNGPAAAEILFDLAPPLRWKAAAALMGVDLDLLSSQAGHG
ncbi:MAG TPA: YqgE/AlgH family protein [Gammaproteobacteria bacterium]|nr:YqgE/AlgH family protein [Gammaproteobacteria bacterium]